MFNVKNFLKDAGITEPLYPGKRLVQACRQEGQYKSHCVVMDWREQDKLRIELKAGLSGKTLPIEDLKKYPVSFQSPTFIDIEIVNDNDKEDDEDEEEESKGKSGGGSKGQKKGSKKDASLAEASFAMSKVFGDVMEGKVPELGEIKEMVVMGMKIAEAAYNSVIKSLAKQIAHSKVCGTELLAKANSLVTKFMPPAFMEPKGDETATYKYDREKNANIGMRSPSIG